MKKTSRKMSTCHHYRGTWYFCFSSCFFCYQITSCIEQKSILYFSAHLLLSSSTREETKVTQGLSLQREIKTYNVVVVRKSSSSFCPSQSHQDFSPFSFLLPGTYKYIFVFACLLLAKRREVS